MSGQPLGPLGSPRYHQLWAYRLHHGQKAQCIHSLLCIHILDREHYTQKYLPTHKYVCINNTNDIISTFWSNSGVMTWNWYPYVAFSLKYIARLNWEPLFALSWAHNYCLPSNSVIMTVKEQNGVLFFFALSKDHVEVLLICALPRILSPTTNSYRHSQNNRSSSLSLICSWLLFYSFWLWRVDGPDWHCRCVGLHEAPKEL